MEYAILVCDHCEASIAIEEEFSEKLRDLLEYQALYAYDRLVKCCDNPNITWITKPLTVDLTKQAVQR